MIVEFSVVDTKDFSVEHLFDSPENLDLIAKFQATNGAAGLECYLKNQSVEDEENNCSRTYLVKDILTAELVAYFSLKTGLITVQLKGENFDSVPAIELANFAINKRYKDSHPETQKLGFYTFKKFILPIVQRMSVYVGVNAIYIYALPEERLINHYRTMGFERLPEQQEKFVQCHVKPKYDEGCIFMYQPI
ncbi:hypothetical protein [uncultured Fibrobacter sp.]|uniref:hypothetical protein n=1 Tax=uncultured Fibrobacter sp. TaxID=261512 RepID=UPI0025CF712E|nr:hypothetical protein [uncultured Fibrobacter sp.]